MCKQNLEITKIFEEIILNFFKTDLLNVLDKTDCNKHPNMPDIEIENKIYIECTVALKGMSSDGQTFQMPSSDENNITFSSIPKETEQAWSHFVHQRLANRLDEKNKKFINNKKNPKFNDKLPRIVAITVDVSELSDFYCFDDIYEDALRKLLWDNSSNIKRQFYSDGSWADIPDKDGIEIKKQNGSIVPSGIFNDCKNNYKNISAVIFVSPNKVSQAKKNTKIDKNDIYLCINRFADIKITEDDKAILGYPKILLEYIHYSH